MVKIDFMQGNMACVEGAIKAGCNFFGGYPITPSTEVAEGMAKKLPKVGGFYSQLEDEIASMAAVIGASWAGAKSMTATSGPGMSLMLENIGYAFMTETPCVIVNVQRGGPSTGQPTAAAQGDMMQVRWGSQGDYEPIALCPSSVQEMYDFTIMAFNYAEKYRIPVFIMADEIIGHMREKVVLHDEIEVVNRKKPVEKPCKKPFPFDKLVSEMPTFGEGYNIHVTGLTHGENGYPDVSSETHDKLVRRICNKILDSTDDIVQYEGKYTDSETMFICYGTPSRTVKYTVESLRAEGKDVGYIRLKTVFPFPRDLIKNLNASKIIVPEMNLGQISEEVMKYAKCDVVLSGKIGGELHRPEELKKLI
ncbi:pyruvate flavodoxin/ferredoxin oxidoreductase domain protein [Methanococcus vannielii SB]|jgi:2-oxoglutarate ferredoxin oxidoreductase subunit alpha|uniref:2-oxoglutarate synthase subunit KorA n=1 Tax=Methanococcus vannielii (strain ATCC 35089 / DSM 1224 / JCM 13029 / OCM 148 / SB) TaxID=406327 RepID=A6URJ4_METVS|nr:2-oxoacid:acceptor oxidoreductase subunit alpha [Methanococcus vannielii]ABR55116.1 pyruvate flavodoxin/ferredoxin oxidoreductase domain protein [Methanococcus vannielii SB]